MRFVSDGVVNWKAVQQYVQNVIELDLSDAGDEFVLGFVEGFAEAVDRAALKTASPRGTDG